MLLQYTFFNRLEIKKICPKVRKFGAIDPLLIINIKITMKIKMKKYLKEIGN